MPCNLPPDNDDDAYPPVDADRHTVIEPDVSSVQSDIALTGVSDDYHPMVAEEYSSMDSDEIPSVDFEDHTADVRPSLPHGEAVELEQDHTSAREAFFPPIDPEDRSLTDEIVSSRGHEEGSHADYGVEPGSESAYFDPIYFEEDAREAHFDEIDPADPYVGDLEFDSRRVEFDPIDLDDPYDVNVPGGWDKDW